MTLFYTNSPLVGQYPSCIPSIKPTPRHWLLLSYVETFYNELECLKAERK